MALKKLINITQAEIKSKGVVSLADRPNVASSYGEGGLSPTNLKLWFDKLATFLAGKINTIQDAISSNEAGKYIRVLLDDYGGVDSLDALVAAFLNGDFAANILKAFPSASATTAVALQTILNNIALQLSTHTEDISRLDSDKLDKIVEPNTFKRAYIVTPEGTQSCIIVSESPAEGRVPVYTTEGRLNAGDPVFDGQAANKRYVDTQDKTLAAAVQTEMDASTYVITIKLKNSVGTVLSTASVDLPLETVVVGGEYDEDTKEVVLTLKNGEQVKFSVADLINGLVSSSQHNSDIDAANGRINDLNDELSSFEGYVEEHKVFSGSALYAEEAETARNYTRGGTIDRELRRVAAGNGFTLDLSMDDDYVLTVALKNRKGETVSSGTVDLPIESMVVDGTYSNGTLTLTLQNGHTIPIGISSLINGLVPTSRTVNGKALSSNISLTASDVGAYAKSETYSQAQVNSAISAAVDAVKVDLRAEIEAAASSGGGGSDSPSVFSAEESQTAHDYSKGGAIDRQFREILKRISALENK